MTQDKITTTDYKFFVQTDYKLYGKPEWHNITDQSFSTAKAAFDYISLYRQGSFNGISRATWNCRVVQATTTFSVVEP